MKKKVLSIYSLSTCCMYVYWLLLLFVVDLLHHFMHRTKVVGSYECISMHIPCVYCLSVISWTLTVNIKICSVGMDRACLGYYSRSTTQGHSNDLPSQVFDTGRPANSQDLSVRLTQLPHQNWTIWMRNAWDFCPISTNLINVIIEPKIAPYIISHNCPTLRLAGLDTGLSVTSPMGHLGMLGKSLEWPCVPLVLDLLDGFGFLTPMVIQWNWLQWICSKRMYKQGVNI